MHVWALGLLCETPALAKVEIGQSSSRPSSLGLREKKWKVFRFLWLFSFRGLFYHVFQALKIFFAGNVNGEGGPQNNINNINSVPLRSSKGSFVTSPLT